MTASQDFSDGRTISSMSVNELVGGVFGSEAKVASDAALGLGYALARMEDEDQHLNLVLAHAKESQGDIHTIELAAFDPYFQRQLGPDDTVVAAFQAQLLYGAGLFEPRTPRASSRPPAPELRRSNGERPGRARLRPPPTRCASSTARRWSTAPRRSCSPTATSAPARAHRGPDRRRRFAHRRVLEPAARASHRAGGPRGRRGGAVDRRLGRVRARRDRDQRAVRTPAPDQWATRSDSGPARSWSSASRATERPGRERVGRMARGSAGSVAGLHAVVSVAERLRQSGGRGLVHATTGVGCQSHHIVLLEATA